jgi:hypothetical protein
MLWRPLCLKCLKFFYPVPFPHTDKSFSNLNARKETHPHSISRAYSDFQTPCKAFKGTTSDCGKHGAQWPVLTLPWSCPSIGCPLVPWRASLVRTLIAYWRSSHNSSETILLSFSLWHAHAHFRPPALYHQSLWSWKNYWCGAYNTKLETECWLRIPVPYIYIVTLWDGGSVLDEGVGEQEWWTLLNTSEDNIASRNNCLAYC